MRINIWACGLVLVSRFPHSLESQKAKAKAGIAEILKILWKLGDVSPNSFFIYSFYFLFFII